MQSGAITADEQKQKAIEIITDDLMRHKRQHIMHTDALHLTAEIKIDVSQSDRECAALLYQLKEWQEAKRPATELLAIADQALTLCPYHIGLLKNCIELAKEAQTDAIVPKLETYYQKLVSIEPSVENFFAYGFCVAMDPTRYATAIKLFLVGIRKDTHPTNTPDVLRKEALKFITKYITALLEKTTKGTTSIELSDQSKLGSINSLDVHTLAIRCSEQGYYEESILCSEFYVWLIVTGLDKKPENQKFLTIVLSRLANTYMLNISRFFSENKVAAAALAFANWQDTQKKFPPARSVIQLSKDKLAGLADQADKSINSKMFSKAGAVINSLLTSNLTSLNNGMLMQLATKLFIENLLDFAEKSLDNKPLFDEAIRTIKKMHIHGKLRVYAQTCVASLEERAGLPRFERLLREGYQHYLVDEKLEAREKLTKAIECKTSEEAKEEFTSEVYSLQDAYVLRSLCYESKEDREAAKKINKEQVEAKFYLYRLLKNDVSARSVLISKLMQHAQCYLLATKAAVMEDPDTAIKTINDALEIYDGNEDAWSLHGEISYFNQDYDTAIKSFSNAIKLRPNQPLNYFYRAFCNPGMNKTTIDLLAGIRSYRFNAEFLSDDVIQDISKWLVICQDQFIAESESHAEIVNLTQKIKINFPNCTALILERAQVWQQLNLPSQAIHDLQLAFFLVKTNIDNKCNEKLLLPNILCHLVIALLDGDPTDLQNAIYHLRTNDFSIAGPDAKEYEAFNAKQSRVENAKSRMRVGTKPKKQTPPENIQAAIELKSLVADINKDLILPQDANLLKAKTRVCTFLRKYAQGGNHARVVLEDKRAFFDLCIRLNAALLKKPVVKEVKESKSSSAPTKKLDIGSVTQPTGHTKHNKKKKEKQKLANEKKQRVADENEAARSDEAAKKRQADDEDAQEYYEKELLAEIAHRADEQYEADRRADEKATAEKLAREEAEVWRQMEEEEKQRIVDEIEAARPDEATELRRQADDASAQQLTDEYYAAEIAATQKAEEAKLSDEQFESDRMSDEISAATKLAEEEAEIWQQMVKEYKAEEIKRKLQELARQLILPTHLAAVMRQLQKSGVRAYICGGQLRRAIRKAKGLPPIHGETDSDLVIGCGAQTIKKILFGLKIIFPNEHIFFIGEDKDGYTFRLKYPCGKVNDRFIYDESRTTDLRASKALSNFKISKYNAVCDHARTCDFTQGAVFYDGELIDAAYEIGMSSALSDIENGILTPIKSYLSDPLLPLRAIYKYGRGEGNISSTDIEFFKTLKPDYFAALEPGVINNWLKKILCHGHAAKNLEKMLEAKLIEKLFPFVEINYPIVNQALLNIARDADSSNPADFDVFYSRFIQVLSDAARIKTSYHQILTQSKLFQQNFAIYSTDPNYCLTKLLSYPAIKAMPHFMHGEIVSLGNQMHSAIFARFISPYAVENFPLSKSLLDFGFKELTEVLNDKKAGEQASQLIINYLSDIARKPQNYQLEHLYAFWILTIAANKGLPIETVINNNLYFKLLFSESIDNYDYFFTLSRGAFVFHAGKLGIYVPDNVLKPRRVTSHTKIGRQLSYASSMDENKLVQVTGEAPKSPPPVAISRTAVAARPAPLTTIAPESKYPHLTTRQYR